LKTYFDTGVLLKLYSAEENSPRAVALVESYGSPICFGGLQHTELRNALHRKCARKEITRQELRKALRDLQTDIDSGVLQPPEIDWNAVFVEANRLTDKCALSTQCRTLDTLHVATALQLGVASIGTTDERQKVLARKGGLKIVDC
jgi:predicted nucleic acid-binding protein